jgi:PTS system ascorbate-specific IIA component
MSELFRKESLKIEYGSYTWQEALKVTGQMLVDIGATEEGYTQAMIDAVNELGPYIAIAPGIALAHAAAGTFVLKNDMAFIVFKEPVLFHSENDTVHLVIGLCALEPNSHIDQLTKLASLLDDDSIVDRFLAVENCDQLYRLVNGESN